MGVAEQVVGGETMVTDQDFMTRGPWGEVIKLTSPCSDSDPAGLPVSCGLGP